MRATRRDNGPAAAQPADEARIIIAGSRGNPALQANARSARSWSAVYTAGHVAGAPHIERQRAAALISVKKSFVDSGYVNLDSANSVEFFTMIGVSVCNRPARAESS